MSKDLNSVLAGWEHDPEDFQVRIVPGDDGREKLQVRVDLGLLQMEMSGRPDGRSIQGHDSLLDLQEARQRASAAIGEDFELSESDCGDLMREGVQYYHRYVALFHLERFDRVVVDTSRNLRLFAFVVRHAERVKDKMQFDQYRPYVSMMRARALGQIALERDETRTALTAIDEGIASIRAFLRDYDQEENEARCPELTFLQDWRNQVVEGRKIGPMERLEEQLELAVAQEDYEEAARVRDQIQRLRVAPGIAPPSLESGPRSG